MKSKIYPLFSPRFDDIIVWCNKSLTRTDWVDKVAAVTSSRVLLFESYVEFFTEEAYLLYKLTWE